MLVTLIKILSLFLNAVGCFDDYNYFGYETRCGCHCFLKYAWLQLLQAPGYSDFYWIDVAGDRHQGYRNVCAIIHYDNGHNYPGYKSIYFSMAEYINANDNLVLYMNGYT